MAKAPKQPNPKLDEEVVVSIEEQPHIELPEVTIGDLYKKVVLPNGTIREDF